MTTMSRMISGAISKAAAMLVTQPIAAMYNGPPPDLARSTITWADSLTTGSDKSVM